MFGLAKFKFGGVTYPLTANVTNESLQDADPALYYALDLFATVIETYVGARLLAQAAAEGLNFPSAVAKRIHYEPSPFLFSHEMVFPLFCLYRTEGGFSPSSISFEKDVSTLTWAYVFPPLTPRQIEVLDPLLRSVEVIVSAFAMQSFDPSWKAGATLRDLSGIEKMLAGPTRRMDFEKAEGMSNWWRAATGKIFIWERSAGVFTDLNVLNGVNIIEDVATTGQEKLLDVVDINTYPAPVLTSISPATGVKAGGTSFTITGTNFRVSTPARVLIGGAYASSVVVSSTTTITGQTPAVTASPSFVADVQVLNVDDQASNILVGAYTFTTP